MHPPDEDPAESAATDEVPRRLRQLAWLMDAAPKPALGVVTFEAGQRPPALDLMDVSGRRISLGGYRGRVTLVNFWVTWCPPCVEEIPSLNGLAQRYALEPFAMVSVDFRESEQVLSEFDQRVAIDFPVLPDRDGRTSLAWKVFSFPSSFLIDRDGYIRYAVNSAVDWNTPDLGPRREADRRINRRAQAHSFSLCTESSNPPSCSGSSSTSIGWQQTEQSSV